MATPGIPTNVVLQTGNGTNLLTWDLIVGATSYAVQRSLDGVTFSPLSTPSTNQYLDAVVTPGTLYFYQVRSVNGPDTSPYAPSYPTSIVPCLPGEVSLQFLRYNAQLRADKLNSNYLTLDEWNSNINQTMYELYDLLTSKFGDDYFLAPPLQITLSGQISYALPNGQNYSAAPALYKLLGVDANVNAPGIQGPGQGWIPVPKANWSDRDRWTVWPGVPAALNNAYMLAYRMMGSQIFFFPANTAQTVQLWYVPVMKQLLQDTDILSFSISGWSEYIVVRSAMLAMSKEESTEKYSILQTQLQMQIERIETQAANRDAGQPNTVSNVRSTSIDPGFGWSGGFGMGGTGWGY